MAPRYPWAGCQACLAKVAHPGCPERECPECRVLECLECQALECPGCPVLECPELRVLAAEAQQAPARVGVNKGPDPFRDRPVVALIMAVRTIPLAALAAPAAVA